MANENGALKAEGRKQVYCMYFNSPNDIDEKEIRSLLFEAGLIDDGFQKNEKLNIQLARPPRSGPTAKSFLPPHPFFQTEW